MLCTTKTISTAWIEIHHRTGKIKIDSNLYFELDIPSFAQYFLNHNNSIDIFRYLNHSVNVFALKQFQQFESKVHYPIENI